MTVVINRAEPRPAMAPPARVSVNGTVISRDAITREIQNHPASKPMLAWQQAARALVIRELLLQEAGRLGIEADPLTDDEGRRETDEEAQVRTLVEQEVHVPSATEAELRLLQAEAYRDLGNVRAASRLSERSLRLYRSAADRRGVAHALCNLAIQHEIQGRLEEAARDLYAGPRAVFRYVTFPLVLPGIALAGRRPAWRNG